MKNALALRLGLWVGVLALPLAGLVTSASAREPGSQKLTVNFPNWKNYSDIRDQYDPTDQGEIDILNKIKSHLEQDATYAVPDGDHLTITFSDIKLAGDFEPQRGGNWDETRIIKSIWYPRFTFTWQLTDGAGHVLRQGSEHILANDFKDTLTPDATDPLGYENMILRNWMDEKIK